MSDTERKRDVQKIFTNGKVTAAYFSTSGLVENKDWKTLTPLENPEKTDFVPLKKEDSGVFMDSSDEDQESASPKSNDELFSEEEYQKLTEVTLLRSQSKYRDMRIYKFDDKLSIISEKSYETDSYQTTVSTESPRQKNCTKTARSISNTRFRKLTSKKKTKKERLLKAPKGNVGLDIPQVYQRQNTSDLLHCTEEQIPVARPSVNRKISNIRNNMYGNDLRDNTKKLQDDLRRTMRKYSTEKTQLLKQLSSLRHQRNQMADSKMNSPMSEMSDLLSVRSNRSQSRYYMAPNLAAHKISKKKKKTKETKITNDQQETNITNDQEFSPRRMKEGILKLPSLSPFSPPSPVKAMSASSKTEWDSGCNNSMPNLPPLDPPPGIAAAQELLKDTYKIPEVTDTARHDITRPTITINTGSKKKVHFAERHTVSEYVHRDFHDIMPSKNGIYKGDTRSLPPISPGDNISVDSIKAYSALPPISKNENDLDQTEVIKATQQYKTLYLRMKDPEERMKTLAEILYSVRLRMIENEQTLKYGINPKHVKSANTLCDFLMNRNHYSSMSMNSELTNNDVKNRPGVPHNTAARSGRKTNSLQLQNYLRKMSKSRRPSEELRISRMMGQTDLSETPVVIN